MKVAWLTPGSGDRFFCQNCHRDFALARALGRKGVQVAIVPLYLPLDVRSLEGLTCAPLQFGALRVYLEQRCPPLARRCPWLLRMLDRPALLRVAARRAGTASAANLADLTLSMLRGEDGRQAAELDRLIEWLQG